jgi:hypothetical protein
MPASDWSESTVLAEWAEKECQHFDLIASWELLLVAYETLGFSNSVDDAMRLTEFKRIITEINKFLTRMKTGLASTTSAENAIEFLGSHTNTDMAAVKDRQSVAYNKLKQRWLAQAIGTLQQAVELLAIQEGEKRDAD